MIARSEGNASRSSAIDEGRATGTKEGCNEGDCGACTVVLGRSAADALVYEPVNACIFADRHDRRRELVTVEDPAADADGLHPVQSAMVAHHGSQCGFCTPGIVMSLFALYQEARPVADRDGIADQLCRQSLPLHRLPADRRPPRWRSHGLRRSVLRRREETAEALAVLADDEDVFLVPRTSSLPTASIEIDLADLCLDNPTRRSWPGATDVGLWVTKACATSPR